MGPLKTFSVIKTFFKAFLSEIIQSYKQLFSQHQDLLQCTTSVKFCQTGFSYEIAIQKCSRVVKTKTEIS